jgi:hypothetical protein
MTTINDLELNTELVKIHRYASILNYLTREGKEHALFMALSDLEKAAQEAQWRLNKLKYRP